jgi:hypothetical protein
LRHETTSNFWPIQSSVSPTPCDARKVIRRRFIGANLIKRAHSLEIQNGCVDMKLPNCELATLSEQKITRYLLNPAHPAGGSKASFFLRFGFSAGGCSSWPGRCSGTHGKMMWSRRKRHATASVTLLTAH